jgi:hypothetical protein
LQRSKKDELRMNRGATTPSRHRQRTTDAEMRIEVANRLGYRKVRNCTSVFEGNDPKRTSFVSH